MMSGAAAFWIGLPLFACAGSVKAESRARMRGVKLCYKVLSVTAPSLAVLTSFAYFARTPRV